MQIACVLCVNHMCVASTLYTLLTWRQIGIALLDCIWVAPESHDKFISATYPPSGVLFTAFRRSNPYSIPAPYIRSADACWRATFGVHTKGTLFCTSNSTCLIHTYTGSTNENFISLIPGILNCRRQMVFVHCTRGQKTPHFLRIRSRMLLFVRAQLWATSTHRSLKKVWHVLSTPSTHLFVCNLIALNNLQNNGWYKRYTSWTCCIQAR